MNVELSPPNVSPSGVPVVKFSLSDWLKIGLFFAAQTIALLVVGIDMRTRLAVLEQRLSDREESITQMRLELGDLKHTIEYHQGK